MIFNIFYKSKVDVQLTSLLMIALSLFFISCGGPKKETHYHDLDCRRIDNPNLALFYRVAYYEDGKIVKDSITEDYYMSGALRFRGHLLFESPDVVVGEATWYDMNGKKLYEGKFDGIGRENGEFIYYDKDGLITKREYYKNGFSIDNYPKKEESPKINSPEINKFLITNDYADDLELGGAIPDFYGGSFSTISYDACATPIRIIGDIVINLKEVDYTQYTDTLVFQDTTKFIYVNSVNCDGYYYKDSIEMITIKDDRFATVEGIGVGTTFQELKKTFPVIFSQYSINVDEEFIVFIKVPKYPKVRFYFTEDDLSIDPREDGQQAIELQIEDGTHFKEDASISEIELCGSFEKYDKIEE